MLATRHTTAGLMVLRQRYVSARYERTSRARQVNPDGDGGWWVSTSSDAERFLVSKSTISRWRTSLLRKRQIETRRVGRTVYVLAVYLRIERKITSKVDRTDARRNVTRSVAQDCWPIAPPRACRRNFVRAYEPRRPCCPQLVVQQSWYRRLQRLRLTRC